MPRHAPPDLRDRVRALIGPAEGSTAGTVDDLAPPPDALEGPRGDAVHRARRRWTRPGGRAIALALLLILAVGIWWWWQGRPRETVSAPVVQATGAPLTGIEGSPASAIGAGATSTAGPATREAPDRLVVHVVGQVARPGVVRLPSGSRVLDAVRAVGGVRVGGRLGPVNLARPLVDGEQIVIGPAARRTTPQVASAATQPAVVDLNAATVGDLEALPGVGPVLAARIIEWRTTHGAFTDIAELREVSGIGDAVFARIAPHVRV